MREQQQKRRVMNARHQALTKAHHRMLLATFANHNASKWLHRHITGHQHCRKMSKDMVISVADDYLDRSATWK